MTVDLMEEGKETNHRLSTGIMTLTLDDLESS